MNVMNAISKVRFATARVQRVQLHETGTLQADLLCFEPGQALSVAKGRWAYYLIAGSLEIAGADGAPAPVASGGLAVPDDACPHSLANTGEQRAVCLAVGVSA